jgi:hypothetical protein
MKKTESHKLKVVKLACSERINQLKSALNKAVPIVCEKNRRKIGTRKIGTSVTYLHLGLKGTFVLFCITANLLHLRHSRYR